MKKINVYFFANNLEVLKIASLIKKYFPEKEIFIKSDNINKNNFIIIFKERVDKLLLEEFRIVLFEKYPNKKIFFKFKIN